jgi:hypothetical protein
MKSMAALEPAHFLWRMEGDVAVSSSPGRSERIR